MNVPKQTKRPSGSWIIKAPTLVLLGLLIWGMASGCEEPVKLKTMPTTMPALKGVSLEKIVAQQREDMRMEMQEFQVEVGYLAHDFVTWWVGSVRADALLMSAARRGDKPKVRDMIREREKLAEMGEKLDAKWYALRLRLSELRMEMVQFDRRWPNLLLLEEPAVQK